MVNHLDDACTIICSRSEDKQSGYTNEFTQAVLKDDEEVYIELPHEF